MKENRFAVIDLGSNTFHLLIVEGSVPPHFTTVCRERIFTALSEGGVDVISAQSMQRGLQAIKTFSEKLRQHSPARLTVIGTASLRHASNSYEFVEQAESILGTQIRIIDGNTEAHYIYRGLMLNPPLSQGKYLIMDVGGGSTEFILTVDGKKVWSKSYPLGVGILHALFHRSEPISQLEAEAIRSYILHQTADLRQAINQFRPTILAGASGSFEILESMSGLPVSSDTCRTIDASVFLSLCETIVAADYEQRLTMSGLPEQRATLIVVGMILKKCIFDMFTPDQILVSPYALKEGVIAEMMADFTDR